MAPIFLTIEEVLAIHADQLRKYGGTDGVRSLEMLQSALAMPGSGFGDRYFHADLYDMAVAYLYHLVQNHPFVDGNKRGGVAAALVFLIMNGIDLAANERTLESLVLDVASGRADKVSVAQFFRDADPVAGN